MVEMVEVVEMVVKALTPPRGMGLGDHTIGGGGGWETGSRAHIWSLVFVGKEEPLMCLPQFWASANEHSSPLLSCGSWRGVQLSALPVFGQVGADALPALGVK